jgi:hypothetical protein
MQLSKSSSSGCKGEVLPSGPKNHDLSPTDKSDKLPSGTLIINHLSKKEEKHKVDPTKHYAT